MTSDPAQQLADIGRRVLGTVQPLVTFTGFDRLPEAYETLLRDPIVALSDTCDGSFEQPRTVPVTAEHGSSPDEPSDHPAADPNAPSSFFSRAVADTPAAKTPQDRYGVHTGPWRESQATMWPDTPASGPSEPPSHERVRRAMEDPLGPLLEESERVSGSPDAPVGTHPAKAAGDPTRPPDQPRRPAEHGSNPQSKARNPLDRYAETGQAAGRVPRLHGMSREEQPPIHWRSPVEDEASAEDPGTTRRPEDGWAEPSPGAIARKDPVRAVEGTDEPFSRPLSRARLATSPERLADMLRAHVADTGSEDPFGAARDSATSARPRDDELSVAPTYEPDRVRPGSRVEMEEIMDGLVDELETGFVRTYGSSGG